MESGGQRLDVNPILSTDSIDSADLKKIRLETKPFLGSRRIEVTIVSIGDPLQALKMELFWFAVRYSSGIRKTLFVSWKGPE